MRLLFCLLMVGCALVFLLFIKGSLYSQFGGGFVRKYAINPFLEVRAVLPVEFNSFYMAGETDHAIYLGNTVGPLRILRVDTNLDTAHIIYSVDESDSPVFQSIKVKVDSPYFYMMDGTVPVVYGGRLDGRFVSRVVSGLAYFLEAVPMDQNVFAVKSLLEGNREIGLGRMEVDPDTLILLPDVLTKQVDGIFCKEGMMQYSRKARSLVYVYYYRNRFIVMDSCQRVISVNRTVDTTEVANIDIIKSDAKGISTMARPPVVVNSAIAVRWPYLFIHSNLHADNEVAHDFERNAVIDVYTLPDGSYEHSFYLRNPTKQNLKGFRVFGKTLIALFNDVLVAYEIHPQSFGWAEDIYM